MEPIGCAEHYAISVKVMEILEEWASELLQPKVMFNAVILKQDYNLQPTVKKGNVGLFCSIALRISRQ